MFGVFGGYEPAWPLNFGFLSIVSRPAPCEVYDSIKSGLSGASSPATR